MRNYFIGRHPSDEVQADQHLIQQLKPGLQLRGTTAIDL